MASTERALPRISGDAHTRDLHNTSIGAGIAPSTGARAGSTLPVAKNVLLSPKQQTG